MTRHKTILFFTAVFFSAGTICAQDINFSQFYELPLLRNPALAGLFVGDVQAASSFRSQWGSVSVPYLTQSLGGQIRMPLSSGDFLALGLQLTNDRAGDSKLGKTQALPVISLLKNLNEENKTYLCLGIIGGGVQQRFDPSQLKFDDQFVNGTYSAQNTTQQTFRTTQLIYWDLSVGLSISTTIAKTNFYAGSALFHLTRPRVAFDPQNDFRLNKKFVVNLGCNFPVSIQNSVTLYGDIFYQGGNRQGQGGFLIKHDLYTSENDEEQPAISAGGFYRWNDAFSPVIKLDYRKTTIGVSYDVNISKLKPASQLRGAFEITLTYRDFLARYDDDSRKTRCPANF